MEKTVTLTAAALLATTVLSGCRQTEAPRPEPAVPPATVRIGALLPLTGRQAPIGMQQRHALELAEERLRTEHGVEVDFLFEDTEGDPGVGEAGARKLMEEQAVQVAFAFPCAVVYRTQPIADEAGALLMACNMDPRTSRASTGTFRVFPNLRQQNATVLQHLGRGRGRRVGLLRLQAPSPDYAAGELLQALARQGWQVVAEATYDTRTRDYGAAVGRIRAASPDVILIYADARAVTPLLKLLKGGNSPTEALIVGGISFAFPQKLPPEILEGVAAAAPRCALPGGPEVAASWFGKEFRARHGKPPHMFAAFCFDGAMLIGQAVKETGGDPDDMRAYLGAVESHSGVTGPVTFDEWGDAEVAWGVGVYRDGKLVPVTGER